MANNSFNQLIVAVNEKISEMDKAISDANGAASVARTAAEAATAEAEKATTATAAANSAAETATKEAGAWENAVIRTETVDSAMEADVAVSESEGRKNMLFKVPRGADGSDGPKGDTGRSGVTFQIVGSKLYITTD